MPMREKIANLYNRTNLATKIRYSYFVLLVPMVLFLVFCFYNLWASNEKYENLLDSVSAASEFSIDFKKDFDYETYLLIAGSKSVEESEIDAMLGEAERIINSLQSLTTSKDNKARLVSVKKYLNNLEGYSRRIEENLLSEDKYDVNIEIWENDVQVVTALLRETVAQYIQCEIRDMQQARFEYQRFFIRMIQYSVVAFFVIVVLFAISSYFIPLSITRPIRNLCKVTDQMAKGNLDVRASVYGGQETQVLSDSLNIMIDKINELLAQVKMEQIQLRKAEFELLQAQINPHFLYNTLDTIVWLAEDGNQTQVVSMVESLSDFFKTSLNHGKEIVTIKEELQHVKSYLEIQQVRYQDILSYEIEVGEDLFSYQIPKITIQPLVENALYHGIKNKRGMGKIAIEGLKMGEDFLIRVLDDGIGMSEERLRQVQEGIKKKEPKEKDIYGLYNVNERIVLNFGEKYGISIESTYSKGTEVSILLPCITSTEENILPLGQGNLL